jgi:hypothetical protein
MASGWSLLTDEWNNHMTEEQQDAFINKREYTWLAKSVHRRRFRRKSSRRWWHVEDDRATKVYRDMTKRGLPRKAIIEAFMNDVGLTKAGSSTTSSSVRR